jgi:hypothetical protein
MDLLGDLSQTNANAKPANPTRDRGAYKRQTSSLLLAWVPASPAQSFWTGGLNAVSMRPTERALCTTVEHRCTTSPCLEAGIDGSQIGALTYDRSFMARTLQKF